MRMRKKPNLIPRMEQCSAIQIKTPEELRGKWAETFPGYDTLELELGCGKSPFLASMGLLHEDINFIGVAISSNVLAVARRNISASYEEAGKEKPHGASHLRAGAGVRPAGRRSGGRRRHLV